MASVEKKKRNIVWRTLGWFFLVCLAFMNGHLSSTDGLLLATAVWLVIPSLCSQHAEELDERK